MVNRIKKKKTTQNKYNYALNGNCELISLIPRPLSSNSFAVLVSSWFCFLFAAFLAEGLEGLSSSRVSMLSGAPSDRLQAASERSRPNSPDPLESAVTEMFVSEENIGRMENILDTWSNNLKVSLPTYTVKLSFHNQSINGSYLLFA